MKRVVVTGANGMIGSTLIRQLVSRGVEVLAIVRPNSGKATNLPESILVESIACDVSELGNFPLDHANGLYDTFFHFAWVGPFGAARDDVYLQHANIRYTLDAVALAKKLGCTTFIGAGSQAEYGPKFGVKLAPDTPASPMTGYGIAKLDAGRLGKLYAGQLDIRFIWARILSIYGPMDKPYTLVMSTIRKLLSDEEVHFTKGEQQWDFLFSEDAAEAFRLMAEKGRDGAVYCLGSGNTVALGDALTYLCHAVRPGCRVGLGDIPYPDNQVMYLCADINTLREDTGFSPTTSFKDGIRKTISWCKEMML
jgi:nucleoside-diphosphate-sugar epimerase